MKPIIYCNPYNLRTKRTELHLKVLRIGSSALNFLFQVYAWEFVWNFMIPRSSTCIGPVSVTTPKNCYKLHRTFSTSYVQKYIWHLYAVIAQSNKKPLFDKTCTSMFHIHDVDQWFRERFIGSMVLQNTSTFIVLYFGHFFTEQKYYNLYEWNCTISISCTMMMLNRVTYQSVDSGYEWAFLESLETTAALKHRHFLWFLLSNCMWFM